MSGKYLDAAAPLRTDSEPQARRFKWPIPTTFYTVFLIILNLAA